MVMDVLLRCLQSPDECIALIVFFILCRVELSISRHCNTHRNNIYTQKLSNCLTNLHIGKIIWASFRDIWETVSASTSHSVWLRQTGFIQITVLACHSQPQMMQEQLCHLQLFRFRLCLDADQRQVSTWLHSEWAVNLVQTTRIEPIYLVYSPHTGHLLQ